MNDSRVKLEGVQLGIHWPHCIDRSCPGCMPELKPLPPDLVCWCCNRRASEIDHKRVGRSSLDLSIFRRDVP